MKKQIIIVLIAFVALGLGLGHLIPSNLVFKNETTHIENVAFEWDDDFDRYDISINEMDEKGLISKKHYYIPTNKAILVYSEETWSCFGDFVIQYNAWGRQLRKEIVDFHINIYRGGK